MTDDTNLLLEKNAYKATLTLNRPKERHALNLDLIQELRHALETLKNDDTVRFIVIKSTGPTFCAGADLHWMKSSIDLTLEENINDAKALGGLLYELYHFPKPTVAVLEGDVFGGGLGLISACDIVLATPQLKMCLSELKLGLIPSMISPYVIKAMGARAFKAHTLTGELFSSEDAQNMGLVHKLSARDKIDEALTDLEKHLLKNAPIASAETKKLTDFVDGSPIHTELLNTTARSIAEIRQSQEGQEGLRAFIGKEKPSWAKSH